MSIRLVNYLNRKLLFTLIFIVCLLSNGVASLYFGYVVSRMAATDAFKDQVKQSILLVKSDIQEGNYGRYVSSTKRFFSSIEEDVGIWLYSSINKNDIIAVGLKALTPCSEDAFEKAVIVGNYYQFCQNVDGIIIQVNKAIKPLPFFVTDPLQLTVSLLSALLSSIILIFLMRSYFSKLLHNISSFFATPYSLSLDPDLDWIERPIKHLYSTIETLRYKLNEKDKAEILAKSIRQVVHDLAAPISGLNILVEKLVESNSKFAPLASSIIHRLKNLTDDLRYRSDVKVELLEKFEIYSSLIQVVENIKAQHDINLELILPENVDVLVYGNKNHFERIIECLVQNSIEAAFSQRPIKVTIKATQSNLYVKLLINDNGRGIRKEDLAQVVLPGITIGKGQFMSSGSGLGLSYAFDKTKEWGGEALIASELNNWTRVELSFLKITI